MHIHKLKQIKKILSQIIGWMLIITIILLSWEYGNTFELFNHTNTIVSGNEYYSNDEILYSIQLNNNISILNINPKSIQLILNELEYVLLSNVSLLPPSTLFIEITERDALIYIKNAAEEYLIDDTGNILSVNQKVQNHYKAPLIENISPHPISIIYNNDFDLIDYSEIITLLKKSKIHYPDFYQKVTKVKQLDENFEFSYGSKNTKIYMNRNNAESELNYIQEFEKTIIKNKILENYHYIDLRMKDQIIVKERNNIL